MKISYFCSFTFLISALKFWWENENWSWRQETWLKRSHSTRTCWNTLGLDTFSLRAPGCFYLHKIEVGPCGSRIPGQAAKMERPGFFVHLLGFCYSHFQMRSSSPSCHSFPQLTPKLPQQVEFIALYVAPMWTGVHSWTVRVGH